MEQNLLSFPTPFTPPTKEEDRISWLRLIRSRRVGPATFRRLMAEHGNARNALDSLTTIASNAGITDYVPCSVAAAQAEIRAGQKAGARLLFLGAPDYPAALAALPDAPPVIWVLGDTSLLARPMVSIVGARSASSLGLRMARALARGLSEAGYAVVSGLARGIDAAAHEAALPATIAVQAGGIDILYPPENASLAKAIGEKGLRISEQPPGLEPQARHFPQRNRIIAGLSRAVVVVEAAPRSGSLITASCALDQGREVMAVPGHPFDGRAGGCNQLLRDGALLVRGPEDVIAALNAVPSGMVATEQALNLVMAAALSGGEAAPQTTARTSDPGHEPLRADRYNPAPARPAPRVTPTAATHAAPLDRLILEKLGLAPVAEDQLIRDLALPVAEIIEKLLALELDGRVRRDPGGMLARVA